MRRYTKKLQLDELNENVYRAHHSPHYNEWRHRTLRSNAIMTNARWHEHETAAYKLLDSTLAKKKKQEHDLHVVQIVHLSLAQQHVESNTNQLLTHCSWNTIRIAKWVVVRRVWFAFALRNNYTRLQEYPSVRLSVHAVLRHLPLCCYIFRDAFTDLLLLLRRTKGQQSSRNRNGQWLVDSSSSLPWISNRSAQSTKCRAFYL